MKRVAFLVSGGGGNLRFVLHYLEAANNFPLTVSAAISDAPCPALEVAAQKGVPTMLVDASNPTALPDALGTLAPDLVVLTYDRILEAETVKAWHNKMVNLHYSLLPAFAGSTGTATIKRALRKGCTVVGTTTHYVVEKVDDGEILCQSCIPVQKGEDEAQLMQAVFQSGCLCLLNTLSMLCSEPNSGNPKQAFMDLIGRPVLFSPALQFDMLPVTDKLWKQVLTKSS